MTIQEFSVEFDILYNNIMSNQAPGLDDYEKSVFLTQAQEAFILEMYSGVATDLSFEETELINESLAILVKQYSTQNPASGDKLSPTSILFDLPSDLWLIIYEQAILEDGDLPCGGRSIASVVPVTHDEYYRTIKNPFRGPGSSRVLRLRNAEKIELISRYNLIEYTMRYISKPLPIILTDLTDYNATIYNRVYTTECF